MSYVNKAYIYVYNIKFVYNIHLYIYIYIYIYIYVLTPLAVIKLYLVSKCNIFKVVDNIFMLIPIGSICKVKYK